MNWQIGSVISYFVVVGLFISGCEEVDDQSIASGSDWQAANPYPSPRDFVRINRQHQVIVASIDTGVDYNHPSLIKNIHFNLDENGMPKSFGYDFVGKDAWAAPYLARTADKNPEADPRTMEVAKNDRDWMIQLISREGALKKYFNPSRNVQQEIDAGVFHGTHVSSLMVYDDPRIGLMAYRILPVNLKYKKGQKDYTEANVAHVYKNIVQAIILAIKEGARVINMSLALRDSSTVGISDFFSSQNSDYSKWVVEVKNLMESHRNVVFVAAAGNEGKWVDDRVNLQIPCGVNAVNLICVGALNSKNDLAGFSNIVLSDAAFVVTQGVDIKSLTPSGICQYTNLSLLKARAVSVIEGFQLLKELGQECSKDSSIKTASGTSMASPIVARYVARVILENPHLSGEDVVRMVLEKSQKRQVGPLVLNIINFDRPSWYQ